MNVKAVTTLVVVLLAAVGGGAYMTGFLDGFIGGTPTGQVVKDTFELETGQDLEVMKVEEEGSLNRVVLSDGEQVIETYVTKDGEYIVNNPINIEEYQGTLEARDTFIACLEEQNAKFFGILADDEQLSQHNRMAELQIQALGGMNNLNNIFQGPGTEGFPQQQVVQNGVVWRLNGELTNGIKTIQQLEETTGCSYDAPNA